MARAGEAVSGEAKYTALEPGALVTGSHVHGTGDFIYALCGELPQGSYGRLHVTVVTVTRDGVCKTISGVHFEHGARPLWVP